MTHETTDGSITLPCTCDERHPAAFFIDEAKAAAHAELAREFREFGGSMLTGADAADVVEHVGRGETFTADGWVPRYIGDTPTGMRGTADKLGEAMG